MEIAAKYQKGTLTLATNDWTWHIFKLSEILVIHVFYNDQTKTERALLFTGFSCLTANKNKVLKHFRWMQMPVIPTIGMVEIRFDRDQMEGCKDSSNVLKDQSSH